MDLFVMGGLLVGVVPVLFTARAWQLLYRDSSRTTGRFAVVVLWLNSATALLILFTILLASSEVITQASVARISVPTFYLCVCITVACGIKIRHRLYRTVFISSLLLSFEWLIIGSLH